MGDEALPGMPNPWPLTVTRTGDGRAVAVHAGPMLLSAFAADDLEMRDLVICALTEGSRFQGRTVAAAFGIQPSQVAPDPPPPPPPRRSGPLPPQRHPLGGAAPHRASARRPPRGLGAPPPDAGAGRRGFPPQVGPPPGVGVGIRDT